MTAPSNLTPAARRKGGRASRITPRTVDAEALPGELKTLEDLLRWTAWTTRAIACGELDRATGATILKGIGMQKIVVTNLHLEQEIRELREQMKQLKAAR